MFERFSFGKKEKQPVEAKVEAKKEGLPNLPPEEYIEDKEKAEEMAHAEKPFQDALLEYEKNLTSDQKKALESIASLEANKVGIAYEKTKTQEDPQIALIRSAVEKLFQEARFEREQERTNLISFAQPEIEEILTQDLTAKEKYERIEALAGAMIAGAEKGEAGESGHSVHNRYHNKLEKFKEGTEEQLTSEFGSMENAKNYLKGMIVGLVEQDYDHTLELIGYLARLGQEDPKNVLSEFITLFNRLRQGMNAGRSDLLDKKMGKVGYLWNGNKKEYTSLE